MHDIKAIRENPTAFDAALARRGDAPVSASLLALDEARRAKILSAENAQAIRTKRLKKLALLRAAAMKRNLNACARWLAKRKPKLPLCAKRPMRLIRS